MNRCRIFTVLVTALLFFGAGQGAWADHGHREARRLHRAGQILPLEQILEKVRADYPGRILEVELEREDHRIRYELEILGEDGVVREVYIDARNGELLKAIEED